VAEVQSASEADLQDAAMQAATNQCAPGIYLWRAKYPVHQPWQHAVVPQTHVFRLVSRRSDSEVVLQHRSQRTELWLPLRKPAVGTIDRGLLADMQPVVSRRRARRNRLLDHSREE
jgi:hypothetical protein